MDDLQRKADVYDLRITLNNKDAELKNVKEILKMQNEKSVVFKMKKQIKKLLKGN